MGRILTLHAVLGCVAALSACQSTYPNGDEQREMNTASLNLLNKATVDQAIITQHTLYPYHFLDGSASLNELGERDLSVLAAHYAEHPGAINVYRGNASEALHRDRLQTVRQELAHAGVDLNRMTVGDGLPGGDGADASDAQKAIERWEDARKAGSSKSPSMQGSSSSSSSQ
jgi:hypothetical protein